MNTLDLIIVAIVAFSTLLGLYWGLIRQVLAIAGLVVGILAASRYHEQAATLVSSVLPDNPDLAKLVGFILIMVLISLIVSAIATVLRLFVGLLFLGWLDHLLGGLLGFIQSVLLASVILALGAGLPQAGLRQQVMESGSADYLAVMIRLVSHLLPEQIEQLTQVIFRL